VTATFDDLIEVVAPGRTVVSRSNPTPAVQDYNVLARFDDLDRSRDAVLALESMERDDAAIGVTVLAEPGSPAAPLWPGTSPDADDRDVRAGTIAGAEDGVDPEGVVSDVAPRVASGGVIGGIVGALVVGLGALAIEPDIWIGAALGGALFGSFVGAVWGAFARMGGSDAYRQTFVPADAEQVIVVSFHSNDRERAGEARDRLGLASTRKPVVIGSNGVESP
jgi:hypothetical protein